MLCGNIPTANATVYVIDTVLMPHPAVPGQPTTRRIDYVDPIRPVPAGAPSPEGASAAGRRSPSCSSAPPRGDEAAFAQLYDATSARVYGLAVRIVRDPAQAEEVAQEAFLDVWRTASRFDPGRGSAIAWMLTIVHRKSVDRVRSAEASTRRDSTYHEQNQPVAHDATAEAARPHWKPAGSAARWPPSRRCSARPWSWRTSADTHTRRWRPCSTCRSAPPRPEYETA